jgi:hypothetical protein
VNDPKTPEGSEDNMELKEPEWAGPNMEDPEFENVDLDEEA